jgi:hypothetical protein
MNTVRRTIEKFGFFLFFFAFFLLAIGLAQGVPILRDIGLLLLLVILVVVITRSARDVMRPRRRPSSVDETKTRPAGTQAGRRPPTHDPDNY